MIAGELTDGTPQSLKVTIPARLLESGNELQLVAVNAAAPEEGSSNAVTLRIR